MDMARGVRRTRMAVGDRRGVSVGELGVLGGDSIVDGVVWAW